MDLDGHSDMRRATEGSRQAPSEPTRIVATFDNGALGENIEPGPIVLTIEATNGDSGLAPWLDDIWWTEVIQRWADCHVTVCIAPTPGALLHPVVLHQVEMLRRVVPDWRIVGHAHVDDVASDHDAIRLATAAYHEVRLLDQPRPGMASSDRCTWKLTLEELFGRVRNEQSRLGVTLPVLVRLPATPPETARSGETCSQNRDLARHPQRAGCSGRPWGSLSDPSTRHISVIRGTVGPTGRGGSSTSCYHSIHRRPDKKTLTCLHAVDRPEVRWHQSGKR